MIFSPDHPVSRDRHYSGICHMPFEKKCRGSFLPICKVTLEESNLSSLITYPKKYPLSWIYILFGNSNSGKKKHVQQTFQVPKMEGSSSPIEAVWIRPM